jgi:GH25 family lysozyme M1 (1,4-beta-N-acetylmuramidase)
MSLNTIGIDISHWDPYIEVNKIDPAVKIAILKISQGTFLDPSFATNAKKLQDSGRTIAGYVWPDPEIAPAKSIDAAIGWIKASGLQLSAVFLDIEQTHSAKGAPLSSTLLDSHTHQSWMLAKAAWGSKAAMYIRTSWIVEFAPKVSDWLAAEMVPLWLAEYRTQVPKGTMLSWADLMKIWLPKYSPTVPAECTMAQVVGHQFTGDRAVLPGFYGNDKYAPVMLDVNMFDPSFFGAPSGVPAVPASVAVVYPWYVNTAYLLNVRAGPGTQYPVIGQMVQGSKAQVKDTSTIYPVWYQLLNGGWVSSIYMKKA